jgi:hypothetical protein
MMLDLSENVLAISISAFPKKLDKYNGPSQNKIIDFDPGMRTICTGYDPDGIIVEVGKSDISKIYRFCNSYDKLQRKWSQPEVKHRKLYLLGVTTDSRRD